MTSHTYLTILFVFTCVLACCSFKPSYYPFGPQITVNESELVGWKRCWNGSYIIDGSDNYNITIVFENCPGEHLLYACRQFSSDPFLLLAVGNRSVVVTDTYDNSTSVNVDNGVNWYWSDFLSIGFAKEGDTIDRYSCDWIPGDYPEYKLCWHSDGESSIGKALPHLTKDLVNKTMFHNGYRCGTATELDDSDWIREIWMPYNQCEDLVCGACEVCDPVNGCVKTEDGIECSAPVASPNGKSSDTAQLVAFGLCTLAAVFAF